MTKLSKRLYTIASATLAFVGLGDVLFTDLFRDTMLEIGNKENLYKLMESSNLNFAGFESNMMAMYNGFSISTGVLLAGIGLFNLVLSRADISWKNTMRYIMVLNMLVSIYFMIICYFCLPMNGLFVGMLTLLIFGFIFFREERALSYNTAATKVVPTLE